MKKRPWPYWVIIAVLLATNFFFATRLIQVSGSLQEAQAVAAEYRSQEQMVAFTQLFVAKVLLAESDVDFETRLQLENMVRAIGDEEILNTWKRFVGSTKEADAQLAVKELLQLLLQRLSPVA